MSALYAGTKAATSAMPPMSKGLLPPRSSDPHEKDTGTREIKARERKLKVVAIQCAE